MEKASFENIHRLLEVSERERHYKALLTSKNLADVRRNLACYNLPIISRPLPSKFVDGKYFFTVDLLHLISSGTSTSGGAEAKIMDRRLVAGLRQGHLPLTVRVLVQFTLRLDGVKGVVVLHLDGVKGVVVLDAFLYLEGKASLPPEY